MWTGETSDKISRKDAKFAKLFLGVLAFFA
jgi:hypothetical protein